MDEVHETLHNELNYLAMVNSLLENHVGRQHQECETVAGLGVQVGFDMGKSFPSLTSKEGADIALVTKSALAFMKANKKTLTDLRKLVTDQPEGLDHFAQVKHDQVRYVHAFPRNGDLDINLHIASAEIIDEVPQLMAEMGMFAFMFAASCGLMAQNLSMQFATVWARKDRLDEAKTLLNQQVTPPAVISLSATAKLNAITPKDIIVTPWADWSPA